MSSYTAHNSQVFKVGLKNFSETQIKPMLVSKLTQAAQHLIELFDRYFQKGDENFPLWTANLHDSTGIGIYCDGRLASFKPTPQATSPQEYDGIQGIIGAEYLDKALTEASASFAKGIWFVLFSTVPYAYHIDAHGSPKERGFRYFKLLSADVSTIVEDVIANLKPITP